MRISLLLIFLLLIEGCSFNPIEAHSSVRLSRQLNINYANKLFDEGLFTEAEKRFKTILKKGENSKSEKILINKKMQIYLQLGRTLGKLCKHEKAEEYFLNLIEILNNHEDVKEKHKKLGLFSTKLELAQLNYNLGNYKSSARYFKEIFDMNFEGGMDNFKKDDPLMYKVFLYEYKDAVKKAEALSVNMTIDERVKLNLKYFRESKNIYNYYPVECLDN